MSIATTTAGCGGDSEDASGNSRITKAEFVEQANEACERERAGLMQRVSEFERRRPDKPLPGADAVHLVYLPTMEAQIWRIEELGIPRGEAGHIDAALDAGRFAVDAVAVKPRVPSIATAESHFAEADKLLRAYGLKSCVTDGSRAAR
jgi:hypothetical protein